MSALRSAFDVLCHQPEIRAVAISKTASGIQIRNAPIRMSERMATNAANISRRTAREENGRVASHGYDTYGAGGTTSTFRCEPRCALAG